MSLFKTLLLRLSRRSAGQSSPSADPDAMTVRDWADLPVHHPRLDAGCAVLRP